MCELCFIGPKSKNIHGRDANDAEFAGFFSMHAITCTIIQSEKDGDDGGESVASSDDETDGT